jgi:hypothetical protein
VNARAGLVVGLVVVLIGGGLSYWFFTHFERAERDVETGLKGEAIENSYLAFQRALRRFGREVIVLRSVSELRKLPDRGTLILEAQRSFYMRPELVETLVNWVRTRRGHLIVDAEWPGIDDPLLHTLEVSSEMQSSGENGGESQAANDAAAAEPSDSDGQAQPAQGENRTQEPRAQDAGEANSEASHEGLRFPGAPRALKVEFATPRVLIDNSEEGADLDLTDNAGTRVLQYRLGRGAVTVMTGFDFFSYRAIGNNDHAEALWRLLAAGDDHGPVWFMSQLRGPTFWAWLGEHVWTVLLSLALLLVAWLARTVPRFGPLVPAAAIARRSLREHLAAAGRFIWRNQGAATLLAAVRGRLMKRIRVRVPALANAQGEELSRGLAALTQSSAGTVRAALTDRADSPHAFVQIVRAIAEIDRRLVNQKTEDRGRRTEQ